MSPCFLSLVQANVRGFLDQRGMEALLGLLSSPGDATIKLGALQALRTMFEACEDEVRPGVRSAAATSPEAAP
jgi:hypothetical protein